MGTVLFCHISKVKRILYYHILNSAFECYNNVKIAWDLGTESLDKELLKDGEQIEIVVKYTKLSMEEVEKIKNNIFQKA